MKDASIRRSQRGRSRTDTQNGTEDGYPLDRFCWDTGPSVREEAWPRRRERGATHARPR